MTILGFHKLSRLVDEMKNPASEIHDQHVLVCRELPSEKQLISLAPSLICKNCRTTTMKAVSAGVNPPAATLLSRCLTCLKEAFLFVCAHDTNSGDIAVFPGSSKSEYHKTLFEGFKCPKCEKPFPDLRLDRTTYEFRIVLPVHARCQHCGACFNIVFRDSPLNYFSEALRLGDSVADASPAAALVFYVAAMENVLQKCFTFASRFNHFLVHECKALRFQNLDLAARLYKEYFELDLRQMIGSNWQTIIQATQKRNNIVHNAGHDRKFNPVIVTKAEVEQLRVILWDWVQKELDPAMKSKFVY
jgi:RNase P subunit RPR2